MRARSVLVLIACTGAMILPQRAAAAETFEPTEHVRRLNARAQEQFNAGDIEGAAETFASIFAELPENQVNREERENNLLVTIETYREAFEAARTRGATQEDQLTMLRRAVAVFDLYEAQYRRVYGTDISAAAAESGEMIHELLARAEGPPPPPVPSDGPITVCFCDRGPPITSLIVSGSVLLAAGLGSAGMIAAGATKPDGSAHYGLVIAGSVLTATFAVAGATLLGVGIHRRRNYMALSPSFARGQIGLSLRGRF